MVALICTGCPDTDIVLSEEDLAEVTSCLAGQTGEDLRNEIPAGLRVECHSYDLRVGERSSNKRQRKAGNATQAAIASTRSQSRKREGLPPRGPLPSGWSLGKTTRSDGRLCEHLGRTLLPARHMRFFSVLHAPRLHGHRTPQMQAVEAFTDTDVQVPDGSPCNVPYDLMHIPHHLAGLAHDSSWV